MLFNEQNTLEDFIIEQLTVGEQEVKRELRKVLWTKYQIKDEDLFNRAYDYIKEYY